ncbi:MAG TPA: dethiobiotin synthase [Acidimicrobiia bacterium]|nr:dethiobiotin synthase [Acidimicrobiia bacterium]
MSRPSVLVVVTGTGTEVGKTWVAAGLARGLRDLGVAVAARKPAQSFAVDDHHLRDAEVLADATGEDPVAVCPAHRSYAVAMAPPMAADALGLDEFTIADLAMETRWPSGVDLGLVEGAGGPRSPLATDGDTVDLARALAADLVVLVADAELGTINAVRLAVPPLAEVAPVIVFLNRYDDGDGLHRRNRSWLRRDHEVEVAVPGLVERVARQRP